MFSSDDEAHIPSWCEVFPLGLLRLWGSGLNMSHIRSISLCDESYAIAKQKGNLSKWVRSQLLRDAAMYEGIHTGTRKTKPSGLFCNAVSSTTCPVCWPHGPPMREEWLYYATQTHIGEIDSKILESDIQERARLNNPYNTGVQSPTYEKIFASDKPKKKHSRLVKLLRRLNPMTGK